MARAAPVVAVSAGVLWPLPRSRATAGLAKRSMPTAEGMTRARTARSPPVMRCRKAACLPGRPLLGQVGRDDRHDGDRDDAVGQLEEGVGVRIRGHRVGPGHAAGQHGDDEEGDLVGQRRSRRSRRRGGRRAQSASSRGFQRQRSRPRSAWRRLGMRATPWRTTPSEVPRPSSTSWEWCCSTLARDGAVAGPESEPDQDADADEVVDDRRPGDRDEAAAGVEERGGQGEEPVGGDLDDEPAQERGGDLALEDDAVDLGGGGRGYRARSGRR